MRYAAADGALDGEAAYTDGELNFPMGGELGFNSERVFIVLSMGRLK